MRAADIIRQVLDMIDAIEQCNQPEVNPEINISVTSAPEFTDELARMKQIAGLLTSGETQYSNEPQERIAGIESVTTDAGGGLNGPKHPSDIRSDSVSMYPNHQHNPGV